jgi:nucleotide-binding universal stress UspA family protein
MMPAVKICLRYAKPRVVTPRRLWHCHPVTTILTPVDFSGISDSVVDQALALAKATGGRIVLLNVLQPPVITSEYGPFMENIGEIVLVGEKAAAKQLARVQDYLTDKGIETDTLQFTGAPVPNILKQAEKLDADYIVMGSHGHTAFYDLLVGSTTHGVLLRATCPVVIVPAEKKKGRKK